MRRLRNPPAPEMPIAPMIDCVFLMLVYFMTTSSLQKTEADLDCPAGGSGLAADPLMAVDEQRLSISGAGEILWNGSAFPVLQEPNATASLAQRLRAFGQTCEDARSEASLRIEPEETAPHQALIFLLDAADASGIGKISLP